MSATDAPPAEVGIAACRDWLPALATLGVGLLVLGILFREELAAARKGWDASAAYPLGGLVLPIALWLAWSRRDRLTALLPAPAPLLAVLAAAPALIWLAAERLGIMEGRQFALIGLVWVMALAVLGPKVCRAMAAPLAYLVFLVPFGAFLVPTLQAVTARIMVIGLNLLGISNYVDGVQIETPAGLFHVAEACAGLRFIVAALAFGALYAFTMFRSPRRRLLVMVLAVVVPILANGLRALGIVVLAEYLGSAEAAAADHVVYGWGFFTVVILLLVAAGLPFREDGEVYRAPSPARFPSPFRPAPAALLGPLALALALALGLSASGPAMAALLDGGGASAPAVLPASLRATSGCVAEGAELRCDEFQVRAELLVFSSRTTWRAVSAERTRTAGGSDEDLTFVVPLPDAGGIWQARHLEGGAGLVATAAWLNGQPAGDGLRSRAIQAWNSLGRDGGRPVIGVVTLRTAGGVPSPARGRALLAAVLEAQQGRSRGELTERAVASSARR